MCFTPLLYYRGVCASFFVCYVISLGLLDGSTAVFELCVWSNEGIKCGGSWLGRGRGVVYTHYRLNLRCKIAVRWMHGVRHHSEMPLTSLFLTCKVSAAGLHIVLGSSSICCIDNRLDCLAVQSV